MKKQFVLVAVLVALGVGSGCAIGIGNRDHDTPRHATLGQELSDLKQAHDSGVISDEEFHRLRSRFIED